MNEWKLIFFLIYFILNCYHIVFTILTQKYKIQLIKDKIKQIYNTRQFGQRKKCPQLITSQNSGTKSTSHFSTSFQSNDKYFSHQKIERPPNPQAPFGLSANKSLRDLQGTRSLSLYEKLTLYDVCHKVWQMKRMLKIRSYHYPVQYMCKEWQFLELKLVLRPPILIPRFQTEQMIVMLKENPRFVRKVQEIKNQGKTFRFLELGCGSGAIGLALSKYFTESGVSFFAEMIDIDQRAVNLSILNLEKNNLNQHNISIKQGDMIKLMDENVPQYFEQFDLIISNPPYISVNQYNQTLQKQVKRYESKLALVGNEKINHNGLFYLEKIIETVRKCHNQKTPIVVIEFGGQNLSHLGQDIEESVKNDYYGKRRFLYWFHR